MNGWTLLAPWWLALGAGVAAVLALLHAITVGRPRPAWLPTARFAPDRAPRAERRLARPADRALLALRALAAALAAVALARPVREPARRRVARVVVADVSDRVTRGAVRDSVRALVEPGDALIATGGVPQPIVHIPIVARGAADATVARRRTVDSALSATVQAIAARATTTTVDDAPAVLSTALVSARRAAAGVAETSDSVDLVMVSPFRRDAVDAGTLPIRATWAGRARMVRVNQRPRDTTRTPRTSVAVRGGPADDALAAAVALAGFARDDAAGVRVVRGAVADADRAWAAAGHTLVVWPAAEQPARGGPDRAGASTPAATARGFVAGGHSVVGAFGRTGVEGVVPGGPGPGHTVARWADGSAAAAERRAGDGCVRTVDVRIPQAGDAALRATFLAVLPPLLAPCAPARDSAALPATLSDADLDRLAGVGPLLAAAPLRAPRNSRERDPLGAALLALAAAILVVELPLRRLLGSARDEQNGDTNVMEQRQKPATGQPAQDRAA